MSASSSASAPDPVALALAARFSYVRVVSRRERAIAFGVSRTATALPSLSCEGHDVTDALAGLLAMHRQASGGDLDA